MLLGSYAGNVPSLSDKWYHRVIDKAHLASIGILGPDFLFDIVASELSSAHCAVKVRELLSPFLFLYLPCPRLLPTFHL